MGFECRYNNKPYLYQTAIPVIIWVFPSTLSPVPGSQNSTWSWLPFGPGIPCSPLAPFAPAGQGGPCGPVFPGILWSPFAPSRHDIQGVPGMPCTSYRGMLTSLKKEAWYRYRSKREERIPFLLTRRKTLSFFKCHPGWSFWGNDVDLDYN